MHIPPGDIFRGMTLASCAKVWSFRFKFFASLILLLWLGSWTPTWSFRLPQESRIGGEFAAWSCNSEGVSSNGGSKLIGCKYEWARFDRSCCWVSANHVKMLFCSVEVLCWPVPVTSPPIMPCNVSAGFCNCWLEVFWGSVDCCGRHPSWLCCDIM